MGSSKPFEKGALTTIAVAIGCFISDILSKDWARQSLMPGATRKVLPGFLQFTLTSNTGAAFSLGSNNSLLMSGIASLMTLAMMAWMVRRELSGQKVPTLDRVGMGCLLGGAIGNLFDRLSRGRVTDFIEFGFVSFPVFNVADVLIDIGIGLLILSTFIKPEDSQAQAAEEADLEQPERAG